MLRGAVIAAAAYWVGYLLTLALGEDLGAGPIQVAGIVWGGFTFLVGLGYWLRGADAHD